MLVQFLKNLKWSESRVLTCVDTRRAGLHKEAKVASKEKEKGEGPVGFYLSRLPVPFLRLHVLPLGTIRCLRVHIQLPGGKIRA